MDELNQWIEEGALVAPHLDRIKEILEADLFEDQMGAAMREYWNENVRDIEMASTITAMLSATKVISAYNFRRVLAS